MIDIQVDISDFVELEEKIEAFGKKLDLSSQILGEVAIDQLARIKTRTLQGRSFKNEPFAPYSASYKEYRQNPPKGQSSRPTNNVDLFFSGQMFGAMGYEMIDEGVRLFFGGDTQQAAKAHGHHHGYAPHKLPARPFFEISDSDEAKIKEQMDESVDEIRRTYFGS